MFKKDTDGRVRSNSDYRSVRSYRHEKHELVQRDAFAEIQAYLQQQQTNNEENYASYNNG